MYSRESNGPRPDPFGTPYLISSKLDTCPLTLQHCLRFLRFDKNQRDAFTLCAISLQFL